MTINLKPFCDPDQSRYAIGKPWIIDGWQYATDGRIAVRVKTRKKDDVVAQSTSFFVRIEPDSPRVPDASLLGWKHDEATDWKAWPVQDYEPGPVACPAKNCDGGFLMAGSLCKKCKGDGTIIGPAYQPIGASWISVHYDKLIRELPNMQVVLSVAADQPVLFRFKGGEGILMPVKRETQS